MNYSELIEGYKKRTPRKIKPSHKAYDQATINLTDKEMENYLTQLKKKDK